MIIGYRRFRERVTSELDAYRRDHRDEHLEAVARMLPPSETFPREIRAPIRFVLKGWLTPGFLPDVAGMRQHNPGFRVSVRRFERPDVGVGARYGFRILATARRKTAKLQQQPVFRAHFMNKAGKARIIGPSNEATAFALRECHPGLQWPEPKRQRGFIDEVTVSIRPAERARNLWVARLVSEEPAGLLAFADSPYGEPWREAFARSLGLLPAMTRWADRYRLVASGLAAGFTSDLEALEVERPRPDIVAPSHAVPRLRARHRDGLVEFVNTSETMSAPDTRWLTVEDARVQDGGTVTTGRTLVSYETAADPSLTFVAGTWESNFGSAAHPGGMLLRRLPTAGETVPEGILLAGRNDDNWYHWLAEYLPRILTVPSHIPGDVPVLVSRRTPATGVEALRELTDRPVVLIDAKRSQPVARLHVAPPVVQVLDTGHSDWASATSVDRVPIDAMRARLGVDTPRHGEGRRVFLNRHSAHRSIGNQESLAEIARGAGLELVDPAGLTFAEQRQLFSSAELVVGASGAVMANYLLMRPGSAIVALTSEQLSDFVLPAVMATVAGCSFRYVLGTSEIRLEDVKDPNHWVHADFVIDEAAFTRALKAAIPVPGARS